MSRVWCVIRAEKFILFSCVFVSFMACTTTNMEEPAVDIASESVLEGVETSAADQQRTLSEAEGGIAIVGGNTCHIPDPAIDRASSDRNTILAPIVHEIHQGLMRLSDNADASVIAVPALAEKFEVFDSGTVFEFTLRNDLKFSDGSPLSAADVKWSWERALKRSALQGRAARILGDIVGAESLMAGRQGELLGVEIIDERRLRVRLDQSHTMFPMMLSDPVASILKKDNVAEWPVDWTNESDQPVPMIEFEPNQLPVGAGPFKLDRFTSHVWEGGCRLTRNPYYWGDSPQLKAVEYVTGTDVFSIDASGFSTGETLFTNGRIDFLPLLIDSLDDAVEGTQKGEFGLFDGLGPATLAYLVFNPEVPPFDDINFRRSIVSVSDTSIFEPGIIVPTATRLLPPSLQHPDSRASRVPFDLEAGRDYVAKSSYSLAQPIVYRSADQGCFFQTLGRMFDQWQNELSISVFRSRDDGSVPLSKQQMKLEFYSPSFPDAYAVLASIPDVFGSTNSSLEFVELRRLINDAVAEADAAERAKKYDVAETYILDQALVLPIWNFESPFYHKVQPWVHNFRISRYSGSVFHRMSFDETAPER